MDWGEKWLVDFNAEETQLTLFDRSTNTGAIEIKIYGSVLEEKWYFKMMGLTFFSKLDRGPYIISIAKTASNKIGALIHSMKFLSAEVALHLYESTIQPCMEYCCHVWAGAPCCYWFLHVLPFLETLAHRQNVASLSLFFRHYFGGCSSKLAQLVPLPYSWRRSTHYSDRLHDFSVTMEFSNYGRLWNSLPI